MYNRKKIGNQTDVVCLRAFGLCSTTQFYTKRRYESNDSLVTLT